MTSVVCFFLRCDSPEKLKTILPRLEQELKDSTKFKDFYQFTFNFAKNPTQKGLGKTGSSSGGVGGVVVSVPMRTPDCGFSFQTWRWLWPTGTWFSQGGLSSSISGTDSFW